MARVRRHPRLVQERGAHRAIRKLEDAGQLRVLRTGKKTRVMSADVLRLLGLSRADATEIVRDHQGPASAADDTTTGTSDGAK